MNSQIMMESIRYKCLNYSHFHQDCFLKFINTSPINKKDLVQSKCDGFKSPSECCWFKDMDYASYL